MYELQVRNSKCRCMSRLQISTTRHCCVFPSGSDALIVGSHRVLPGHTSSILRHCRLWSLHSTCCRVASSSVRQAWVVSRSLRGARRCARWLGSCWTTSWFALTRWSRLLPRHKPTHTDTLHRWYDDDDDVQWLNVHLKAGQLSLAHS